ncbi:MAG: hypothetical protein Q4F41_08000 [Eubacteriales bacterium]|nr:hypothetical protein [Eubacteriales bacterium]
MKRNMDELLKQSLTPAQSPDPWLNQHILCQAKEMETMTKKTKRIPAAAAGICILLLGSVTALAAWEHLNPAQVAEHLEDTELAEAFQREDALYLDETQAFSDYKVTLLGAAAGKDLSSFLAEDDQGKTLDDMLYTVVAIEKTDGTPMPAAGDAGYEPFFVSSYISGLNPAQYNAMTMGGVYQEFVQEGILYRLFEISNLEIFADRTVYVGVSTGTFYDSEAYSYDEASGLLSRNESYDGVNALFTLPLDTAKADAEAANAFLENLEASWHSSDSVTEIEEDAEITQWYAKVSTGNLTDYAQLVESTVQECTADEDGVYAYSWEYEGASGSGTFTEEFLNDAVPGEPMMLGYSYSDGLEDLVLETCTRNEDSSVTFALYTPLLVILETSAE